ncbi:MAG: hypothetical protein H9W81_08000 [Enterococcus sp.]|nr:hypothetical protein [Enterococcus sp.]
MAGTKTAEKARRLSVIDEINELVLSLQAEADKIQSHIENVGLEHYKIEDLDYLAISLTKVLDECDGVTPSLISKSHYTR